MDINSSYVQNAEFIWPRDVRKTTTQQLNYLTTQVLTVNVLKYPLNPQLITEKYISSVKKTLKNVDLR